VDDTRLVEFNLQAAVGGDVHLLLLNIVADALLNGVRAGGEIEPLHVLGTSGECAVDVNLRMGIRALDLYLT
jgi:hypothetical protein